MGKASRKKKEVAGDRSPVAGETALPRQPATGNRQLCIALVVLTLLVFGRTVTNGFIDFDDPDYIAKNAVVQRGLTADGVKYAFTALQPYYWQPLTWLSHELDCALFGLRPGVHHLMSVVLHGITAALLFLFLQRATGRQGPAAIAAAIWAVHPLRVESVAWAAERKDVLSGLFFAATLLAYERYARARSGGRYALVVAMYALALMAKPTVVTLPPLLVLLNFWPFPRRGWRQPILEAIPLAVLSAAVMVTTLVGQRSGIASEVPLSLRLGNAARAAGAYLGKLVAPFDLAVIYPYRKEIAAAAAVAGAVLIAVSWLAWQWRERRPYLAAGWGWYLIMLLPVAGIVQSGAQSMADRFTYIPSMGIVFAAVWLVADWLRSPAAQRAAAAAAVAIFAAVSVWQIGFWRDTITLFSRAVEVIPDNPLARMVLGRALLDAGRGDEATEHFQQAARTGGGTATQADLGAVLVQHKRFVEAVEPLQRAADDDPNQLDVQQNLAAALIASGRPAAALPHIEKALQLSDASRHPDLIAARGEANLALGKVDEAIADFQRAVQAKPSANTWSALAAAYSTKNDFARAESAMKEAIRLDADNYDARMNYAAMLSRAGRNDEAVAQVREAIRVRPDSIEPKVYLALIEGQMGRRADAAVHAEEAQRIDAAAANEYLTKALRLPPKETNLADFIAAMRAR